MHQSKIQARTGSQHGEYNSRCTFNRRDMEYKIHGHWIGTRGGLALISRYRQSQRGPMFLILQGEYHIWVYEGCVMRPKITLTFESSRRWRHLRCGEGGNDMSVLLNPQLNMTRLQQKDAHFPRICYMDLCAPSLTGGDDSNDHPNASYAVGRGTARFARQWFTER